MTIELLSAAESRVSRIYSLGRFWRVPVNPLAERPGEDMIRLVASAANGDALLVRASAQTVGNRSVVTVTATATTPGSPNSTEVKPADIDAWFKAHTGRVKP